MTAQLQEDDPPVWLQLLRHLARDKPYDKQQVELLVLQQKGAGLLQSAVMKRTTAVLQTVCACQTRPVVQ
jgi:hypothetical protein